MPPRPANGIRDPDEYVEVVAEAVDRTSRLSPVRVACLERSIVLSNYLRRKDYATSFHVGVSLRGFQSHAWIQIDNDVLIDDANYINQFTSIMCW